MLEANNNAGNQRMVVLADDLTGACDVGAEFTAAGWTTSVCFRSAGCGGNLKVINTQSRHLSAGRAVAKVERALGASLPSVVFKKIDTALRGHLGAELEAVLRMMTDSIAIVAPAIPEVGRSTRGGCQWTGQVLLHEAFKREGISGVGESSIVNVLARETELVAQVADLQQVRSGRLGEVISEAIAGRRRIVVVDAESEADLAAIAGRVLCLEQPVVLVGSTGLARAFVRRLVGGRAGGRVSWTWKGSALVVAGSGSQLARRQTEIAARSGAARRFVVNPRAMPRLLIEAAAREITRGGNVIIEAPPIDGRPTLAKKRQVETALADTALSVAKAAKPQRLMLIGGESAHRVLFRSGTLFLTISGTVAPLVPSSSICGGAFSGLPLLTKGGSTGSEFSIYDALVAGGSDENHMSQGGVGNRERSYAHIDPDACL